MQNWLDDVSVDVWNDTKVAVKRIVNMVEKDKDGGIVIAKEVYGYIMTTTGGWFTARDIYNYLHISEYKDKKNVITCLIREIEKGEVERHPTRNGIYRRIVSELEPINWRDAPAKPLPLKWPLGLESLVYI